MKVIFGTFFKAPSRIKQFDYPYITTLKVGTGRAQVTFIAKKLKKKLITEWKTFCCCCCFQSKIIFSLPNYILGLTMQ